jgi:ribosomal protein S18 acetylase RimI-like enzyme
MKIRIAKPKDLNLIHEIVINATRHMDEYGINQWDEIYPNKNILQNDIEKQELYVIEIGRKIVGFIVLNEDQSPEYATLNWEHNGRAFIVHRLTINPDYQRQGLATRLMDFAEKSASLNGFNCIRLDAFTHNPAAFTLYENRGYSKAGVVRFRKGEFFCFEKAVNKNKTRIV